MPTANGPRNQPRFDVNDDADFAADLTTVSEFAALVGNRKVGSASQRNAAAGADVWTGLEWYDTTDGRVYLRVGSTWKATIEDTDWQTATIVDGQAVAANPPRYRKINGVVYIKGQWVPTANSQTAFVLPARFRPSDTTFHWLDRTTVSVRCQVTYDGQVAYIGPGGTGPVTFAGIPPFPADQ